ncbi:MAG: MBL fold metallo-hydrolase [Nanoarchaeota archaeon]|nr:MBL fold metallo-hydrolase [Nanoarchaeota archaeon]MBU1030802.1 MBL fold metallo-hydrolase [Nanoarchaeota archaeon]MBU1849546.1 MBL fold metallo-hydrolase [Nanoarchaeota archaeon]
MQIKLYGVRGSIPAPSTQNNKTNNYGGNTTCLEVKLDNNDEYILDMGSGLRQLGIDLLKTEFSKGKGHAKIFLSHVHWDHIQGFPFFKPAYIKGNRFDIYGERKMERSLEETLAGQQQYPNFPVTLNQMKTIGAEMNFHDLEEGETVENGAKTSYIRVNHPDGCFSYKIEEKGKKFIYCTDNEHDGQTINETYELGPTDKKIIEWTKNADLLYYDAQYTPEEYDPQQHGIKGFAKKGWGHSTYERGIDIALVAGVKKLILGHHEPEHDDKKIDEITAKANQYLSKQLEALEKEKKEQTIKIIFAKEGETYKI